jgi:hypothetical protein
MNEPSEIEKLRSDRQRLLRALHLVRRELVDTKTIDRVYLMRLIDEGFLAVTNAIKPSEK